MDTGLNLEYEGPVVVAEIANPPENEFTQAMCRRLADALNSPPAQSRIMLLKSVGPNFCGGRVSAGTDPLSVRSLAHSLAEVNAALVSSRLIVVCQVGGDATGFGFGLVGLSDVSIVSRDAIFKFPEVNGGLAPALVLSWLPHVVGRRQAFWLTATAAEVDSAAALDLGLVNFVGAPDEIGRISKEVVDRLLSKGERVLGEIKSDLRSQQWLAVREDGFAAAERLAMRSLLRGPTGSQSRLDKGDLRRERI